MKKILLNLGCGTNTHKDWVNVDISSKSPDVVRHDLRKGIPFEDAAFDVVYHSHVLEHFSKTGAVDFIRECNRVLKKGGIIRICVPDLEQIAKFYISSLDSALRADPLSKENYEWMVLELLDQTTRNESGGEMQKYLQQPVLLNENFVFSRVGDEARNLRKKYLESKLRTNITKISLFAKTQNAFRQLLKSLIPKKIFREIKIGAFRESGEIHQWMYDRYSLATLLNDSGFYEIHQTTASESLIPDWVDYMLDLSIDGTPRKPDSLYLEAMKR